MKRLFKLIRKGVKIIPPDKDAVLCYCDRTIQINSLKSNVQFKGKKIFFAQGNRRKDHPGGIVKRFARYSLGSVNKIEPFIKITDLFSSNDRESNNMTALSTIAEYLTISASADIPEFIEQLKLVKSNKIILPFYYDFDFDEDSNKFCEFLDFTDELFTKYGKINPGYQLFFIVIIYSEQPDYAKVTTYLEKCTGIKMLSASVDKLKPVSGDDIIDWLEKFITTSEFSSSLYEHYFTEDKDLYTMQEVNIKLGEIIEDLGNGKEAIKNYL